MRAVDRRMRLPDGGRLSYTVPPGQLRRWLSVPVVDKVHVRVNPPDVGRAHHFHITRSAVAETQGQQEKAHRGEFAYEAVGQRR